MQDPKSPFTATSSTLTLIKVADLKVGMYVSKLDKPWLETSFLYHGFMLKHQADIDAISDQCAFVFIDVNKQSKALAMATESVPYSKEWLESRTPPERLASFRDEIEHAGVVYQQTIFAIKSFMEDLRLGRPISFKLPKKAVADCVDSILHTPDALLWMTQLKNRDFYTSQHSLNVCILAIILGRQIDLPAEDLKTLGLCGMLHDMGKLHVPLEILNKPGPLTPSELETVQNHTDLGWKLLRASGELPASVVDVAHNHHERLDGMGYPRRLSSGHISPLTRIIAIADMYDTITSDCPYQKRRTHPDAIAIMTSQCGNHIDTGLTYKFIECLGVYPPGSILEMTNGEIAIVIEVDQKKRLKPKVILLLDEDKKPRSQRIVDLSKIDLDASGQPYIILKAVAAEKYGIVLSANYLNGIIAKSLASK